MATRTKRRSAASVHPTMVVNPGPAYGRGKRGVRPAIPSAGTPKRASGGLRSKPRRTTQRAGTQPLERQSERNPVATSKKKPRKGSKAARSAAAKKGVATRKRNAAKKTKKIKSKSKAKPRKGSKAARSAAAKKGARTRKRNAAKKTTAKKKTVKKSKGKRTTAARRASAKKGAATRKRNLAAAKRGKSPAKKGKRTTAARRASAKKGAATRKRNLAAAKRGKSPAKRKSTRKSAAKSTARKPVRWRKGVHHPFTGKLKGGQVMSKADKSVFKANGLYRKGKTYRDVQAIGHKPVHRRTVGGQLAKAPRLSQRKTRIDRRGTVRYTPYGGKNPLEMAKPLSARIMDKLPTKQVIIEMVKQGGLLAGGFAGGITFGRLFAGNGMVRQHVVPHTGAWTAVIGNGLGAVSIYALSRTVKKVEPFAPWLIGGAVLSAIVNGMTILVNQGTISPNVAAWIAPWAAAPAATVAVANGASVEEANGVAGMGQIDVYEAGMGGVEEQLEHQLRRSGVGSDGIFDKDGIFGEYEAVAPYTSTAEQGVAGYERAPVGSYETTPMSAEVEEAFAGYERTPVGADVMQATAGMGNVMQATAGMGNDNALLQQIAVATRRVTQRRLAEGKPVNAAFIAKMRKAAARLAARSTGGSAPMPGSIPGAPTRFGLTQTNRGLYRQTWGEPINTSPETSAQPIDEGMNGDGIFNDDEGIFN